MRVLYRAGFTLIEMIVVISIITMLIGGSALGYGRYQKNARDTRRRSDLEQIRAALELFRSNQVNSNYPRLATWTSNTATGPNAGIGSYINGIPQNPSGAAYSYAAVPAGCTNVGASLCTSYTVTTDLELVAGVNDCTVTPLIPAPQC